MASSSVAADMAEIRGFYTGITGRYPELQTPVRLLEEDEPAVA